MQTNLIALAPGDELPPQTFGPITRTVLALYAGGSGDHNPMHIDSDFAHAAGQPDVFAHGMLSMAYLGRYLLGFCGQEQLLAFSSRFLAITPVNTCVHCSGVMLSRDPKLGEVQLGLVARIDGGIQTASGHARISCMSESPPLQTNSA